MVKNKKSIKEKVKKNLHRNYILRLYVAGKTPNCLAAFKNLEKICQEEFPGQYTIEIIDLLLFPEKAKEDQIMAIPTVIKKLPKPLRRTIGDLSNKEEVLIGLDLHPTC